MQSEHVVSPVSKTDKEYFRVVKRIWVVNVHVVSLVSKNDKEYSRVVKRIWVANVHVVSLVSKTDKEYCGVVSCKDTSKQPLGSSRGTGSSTSMW
jgi:ribosomal protein L28